MNLDLFQTAPTSTAEISPCGLYRYRLTRTWDAAAPALLFVMLNPSTADASEDDPTIRRCLGFARRERAGGLVVANLFAFRATDPKALEDAADPIGPDNARWIETCVRETSGPIVAAWGASVRARVAYSAGAASRAVTLDLPRLTPTATPRGGQRARCADTASMPALLNPIRLSRAPSSWQPV